MSKAADNDAHNLEKLPAFIDPVNAEADLRRQISVLHEIKDACYRRRVEGIDVAYVTSAVRGVLRKAPAKRVADRDDLCGRACRANAMDYVSDGDADLIILVEPVRQPREPPHIRQEVAAIIGIGSTKGDGEFAPPSPDMQFKPRRSSQPTDMGGQSRTLRLPNSQFQPRFSSSRSQFTLRGLRRLIVSRWRHRREPVFVWTKSAGLPAGTRYGSSV